MLVGSEIVADARSASKVLSHYFFNQTVDVQVEFRKDNWEDGDAHPRGVVVICTTRTGEETPSFTSAIRQSPELLKWLAVAVEERDRLLADLATRESSAKESLMQRELITSVRDEVDFVASQDPEKVKSLLLAISNRIQGHLEHGTSMPLPEKQLPLQRCVKCRELFRPGKCYRCEECDGMPKYEGPEEGRLDWMMHIKGGRVVIDGGKLTGAKIGKVLTPDQADLIAGKLMELAARIRAENK